ncbi:MAG: M3 family oligoendopeptidase [Anaerolineales bacterium]|nr:M3 family oligoendopeptidase [Anaerolineales bacterium]
MPTPFPADAAALQAWTWAEIAPHYAELSAHTLTADTLIEWLGAWSRLAAHVHDLRVRLYVATTVNTADTESLARYERFLSEIFPAAQAAEQALKEKLLASGLEPAGFEIPLKNMRTAAALFREANLPLLAELEALNTKYDQIVGAQTIQWEGEERTPTQVLLALNDPDRARREAAWRAVQARFQADRAAINAQWVAHLVKRRQVAANAGYPDYRAYRWQELLRFDYTPEDCASFHAAIEAAVVPATKRLYERRRRRLGLDRLRPWDLQVDTTGKPALKPFSTAEELIDGGGRILGSVDPALGSYFDTMRAEQLLDLENRRHKAPGGYCDAFLVPQRPYIFMNAVGKHDDVQTLLHEAGHSFHVFESAHLPYIQQMEVGSEFAEVASMGMELLAAPYLGREHGGFYTPEEANRARVEHLEGALLFWPYMAVVDAFQQWVYTNAEAALDPANCDAAWLDLWQRFMPGVDWSGLETECATGWHRKLHIHQLPFYYVEYGLAQLGAVQLWRNARHDQAAAVAAYRRALALGGTVPLPQLYAAAGVRFAFDAATLGEAVALMESTIEALDPA